LSWRFGASDLSWRRPPATQLLGHYCGRTPTGKSNTVFRTHEITDGDPSVQRPVSQLLWESWDFPIHTGTPVNGALRSPWVLFGLSPLLLAVTGMTTWLLRRRKRRAKAAMLAV